MSYLITSIICIAYVGAGFCTVMLRINQGEKLPSSWIPVIQVTWPLYWYYRWVKGIKRK